MSRGEPNNRNAFRGLRFWKYKLKIMNNEPWIHASKPKPAPLYYEVVKAGEVLFKDPCYAICNSYIMRNMIQGVRPQPVYE